MIDKSSKCLGILIPYYNALKNTSILLDNLVRQIENLYDNNICICLVDDGCKESALDIYQERYGFIHIIHLESNSGTASHPRNVALDYIIKNGIESENTYITFIDSDDDVSSNYVSVIMNTINEFEFDYCLFNWLHHEFGVIRTNPMPPLWNCSVWNTVYKLSLIGDNRFKEDLVIGEDYEFNIRVRKGVKKNIDECLYIYKDTENSLTKRG